MPFPAMTDPSRGMNDPDIPLIYAPAAKMKIRLVGVSPDKSQPHHPGSAEVTPFLPEIGKSQGDRKWARIFMGINGSAFMRIKGKNPINLSEMESITILPTLSTSMPTGC